MTDTRVFAGRSALVTGGSGAIGAASAKLLLRDGAAVVLMGRRLDALEEARRNLAKEVPHATIELFAGDGGNVEDMQGALEKTRALQGRLDLIISTVGGGGFGPLLKCDIESFRATLDLNITTAFIAVRFGVPLMTDGGAIVCISSTVATKHHELLTPYCTAKGGLEVFVQAAATELARHKVRINAVRPGFTRAGGTAPIFANEKALARTVEMIPLGRAGEPEDIAAAVRYLAGPEASFVTGQSIAVAGGGELNAIAAPPR